MNANELADCLEFTPTAKKFQKTQLEAATMLRQQADLIRNLQKSLGFKNSGYETINLTPAKELTDEEIEFLYENTTDSKDFARAILKKAQEK